MKNPEIPEIGIGILKARKNPECEIQKIQKSRGSGVSGFLSPGFGIFLNLCVVICGLISGKLVKIILPGGNPSLYWELAIEHMDETSDISESGKFWGKWFKAREVGDRGDLGEFGAVSDSDVDELDFFRSLSIRLPHIMLERLEWLDRRTSPSIELEKVN